MSDLLFRWPDLRRLCEAARQIGGLQVWTFGSALRSTEPHDIDVLIVYMDAAALNALRARRVWELCSPPLDVIAMMPDEAEELDFVRVTSARRVV